MNNVGRLPAEWEQQSAIMLAWPHKDTDWAYMLEEAQSCFHAIVKAILSQGERVVILTPEAERLRCQLANHDAEKILFVEIQTNDTWARDICAITTRKGKDWIANDFKFNGWGLKFASNFDNMVTSSLFKQNLFNAQYANHLNFVLEGGSIESNGNGILMTTSNCLLSPNRNGGFSQKEIEHYLKQAFGIEKILWLEHGFLEGDDTDSHIDTLSRFAPNDTILYVGCDNPEDSHFEELGKMEQQLHSFSTMDNSPFRLLKLPLPNAIYDENGERLPATYANFLIGNGFVLVPTYNQPAKDNMALNTIQKAFDNYKIIGVNCNALIKQHGSLHCVTMQFPQNVIK